MSAADGGTPSYAATAFRAATELEERWWEQGNPAERDEAIRLLGEALAAALDTDPVRAAICASLARLLCSRYEDGPAAAQDGDDLDHAIEVARTGLRACAAEPPEPRQAEPRQAGTEPEPAASATDQVMPVGPDLVAELRTVLGFALADRFTAARAHLDPAGDRAVAAARADRDEAIAELSAVLEWTTDDFWPEVANTLGRMRHDRYDDPWPDASPPDPADLDAAVYLLLGAVQDAEPDPTTVVYLSLALSDRFDLRSDPADRDAMIAWTQRGLDLPGNSAEAVADIHWRLATALLDRAEAQPRTDRADLTGAVEHLEAVLAHQPVDGLDRRTVLVVLTHACWQLVDGSDSRHGDICGDIDKVVKYGRQAWPLLAPGDEARADIGLYLSMGLHEQLRGSSQPPDVAAMDLGVEVLTQIEPLVACDPDVHLTVTVSLGLFLVARGQQSGNADDLKAARPWLLHAAAALPPADPRWSETRQSLAAAMFTTAYMGMAADLTDEAVRLLTAVTDQPAHDPERAAIAHAALGSALVQRAIAGTRTQDLDDGIKHLTKAYERPDAGAAVRIMAAANLGSALLFRFLQRGDAQDRDAARYYVHAMADAEQIPDIAAAMISNFAVSATATRALLQLTDGLGSEPAALDEAVTGLHAALAMLPPGHPEQARIRSDLGLALTVHAARSSRPIAELQQACDELNAAVRALPPGHMMRPMTLLRLGTALTLTGMAARDPRLISAAIVTLKDAIGEVEPHSVTWVRFLAILGQSSQALYRITGEPVHLEAAISWLEQAGRRFASHPGHPQHALCLILLARLYRERGDAPRARTTGLAALHVRIQDVLLQTGTARGLSSARAASVESREVAAWCLDDKELGEAVEALELGRGLVLHAATSVSDLPALLTEVGRPELADQWRRTAAFQQDAPWDTAARGQEHFGEFLAGTVPLQVPDDLRVRALTALAGSSAAKRLLSPPSARDIAAALASSGADALVYLLPPAGSAPGRALLLANADGDTAVAPEELPLPLLRYNLQGARDDYLKAHAALLTITPLPSGGSGDTERGSADTERSEGNQARTRTVQRWRDALGVLCDWAWPTTMGPLLTWASQRQLRRPPRLVLIPAGRLGMVPWHAARTSLAQAVQANRPQYTYACADAVISYAASGRQLIEISNRQQLPLQARPVVISDPICDLPFAPLEADAIRKRCYPGARYLGYAPRWFGVDPDGAGTDTDVLAQLPGPERDGASMLHLGCHANVVGSAPGQSYLVLAGYHRLTVDAVLRQASGRPSLKRGGIVCLAACRSDLAADEHDEALTLATAFLAAGAVTVVGARWEIPDGDTTLLMFMFHHFMTSQGRSPRDSLRLAQLWMLDPRRAIPPEMPEALAKDADDPKLADVTFWAAITHQGR